MRNFTRNNVLAFASCAALLFSACGDDSKNAGGSVEDQEIIAISDKTVTGVSQKGPFVNGSSVTVQELNGETLAQTGLGFEGKIKNDMGEFSVKVNKLESQYALLKANGFYRNEVTGEKSRSQVTLYALTDLSKRDEVNVNLLTHLSYERSLYLATEVDSSVAGAKKQAETEVLKSFEIEGDFGDAEDLNIFGESDQSAALLAISVLMQGNLSEGDFSERLADYAADIESDGVWNDAKTATQIADWAITQSMSGGLALIRNNIANWKLSADVPSFEKYVDNFWWQNYGLGTCDKKREGEVKKNQNAASVYADKYFICKSNLWYVATTLEYDTYEQVCDKDGKVTKGNVTELPYLCDNKTWREADEAEAVLDGCIENRVGEVDSALGTYYVCENRTWREATDLEKDTYKWKEGKDADVKSGDVVKSNCYVYENSSWRGGDENDCVLELLGCTQKRQDTVGLGKDKVWYICDAKSWREATNIEKDTFGWKDSTDGAIKKGSVTDNVYVFDKNTWRAASNVEAKLGGCVNAIADSIGKVGANYYICKSNKWVDASVIEYDTYRWLDGVDGEIRKGTVTDSIYVFDATAWRVADYIEKVLGGCVDAINDSIGVINKIYYVCKSSEWVKATVFEYDTYRMECTDKERGKVISGRVIETNKYYCSTNGWENLLEGSIWDFPKEARLNPNITYGTLEDSRDNKIYRTVKIGNQTWMAENLNYADSTSTPSLLGRSWCFNNEKEKCDIGGRLYTWTAAVDSVKLYEKGYDCGVGKICNLSKKIQGICPEGWHIPMRTEWEKLLTGDDWPNDLNPYKASSGWSFATEADYHNGISNCYYRLNKEGLYVVGRFERGCGNGSDVFGFSAVPVGVKNGQSFYRDGMLAGFWSSSDFYGDVEYQAYMVYIAFDNNMGIAGDSMISGLSVRCIKDEDE